jgi:serine/threonine protein kinase/WD40 repeat protein
MNTIDRASAEGFDLAEFQGYAVVTDLWAEGASSRVYHAIEVALERPVALKLLKPSQEHPAEARARFLLEGRIGALLDHRHIVPTFRLSESEQEPYLAMGWCGGGSLAERLCGDPWSPGQTAELVKKLAEALTHAHGRGVVHRDIKPGNILFDEEDEPLLADFGIARFDAGSDLLTGTCEIRGTPAYLAPEVALNGSRAATEKTDLYALGEVLFELLTGRPPLAGKSTPEIMTFLRAGLSVSLRTARNDVSKDLAVICDRCLEHDPELRPGSAQIVVEELDRYQKGLPGRLRPVSILEHSISWARRRPGLMLGSLVMTATLVLVTGLAVWQSQRAKALTAELRTTVDELTGTNRRLEIEAIHGELEATFKLLENSSAPRGLARLGQLLRRMPDHPETARRVRWLLHDRGWIQPAGTALPHEQEPVWTAFRLGSDEVVTADRAGMIRGWSVARSAEWPTNMEPNWRISLGSPVREVHLSADGESVLGWQDDGSVQLGFFGENPAFRRVSDKAAAVAVGSTRNAWALVEPSGLLRWGTFDPGNQNRVADLAAVAPEVCPVGALAFSESNGLIGVSNQRNGIARVFDTRSGSVTKLSSTDQPAEHLFFSPNGSRLLHVEPRTLVVWDVVSGKPCGPTIRHGKDMRCVVFTPAGDQLMAATEGGMILIWDIANGQLAWSLQQPSGLNHVVFGPDRRTFFTSSDDGSIGVFDFPGRKRLTMSNGHDLFTWNTSVSADGQGLVSVSSDHTARLWRCRPEKALHDLDVHARTLAADWLPGSRTLALAAADGLLHLWNPIEPSRSTQRPIGTNVTALVGWERGSAVVVGRSDGEVSLEPLGSAAPRHLAKMEDPVTRLFADEARNRVMVTTARGWQMIDLATGIPLYPSLIPHAGVREAAISPDGTRVVLAGDEWGARLFATDTGASLGHLEHLGPVRQIRFSHDGERVLTAGLDFLAKVWNGSSGKLVLPPVRHPEWVTAGLFSQDGRRLLTAGPKAAFLWDVATGKELARYGHAPTDVVREVDEWAEKGLVLTATTGGRIALWDETTGVLLSEASLPGPSPEQPSKPMARFIKEAGGFVAWTEQGTALWKTLPPETASADLADLCELVSDQRVLDDGSVERIDPPGMKERAARLRQASRLPEKLRD